MNRTFLANYGSVSASSSAEHPIEFAIPVIAPPYMMERSALNFLRPALRIVMGGALLSVASVGLAAKPTVEEALRLAPNQKNEIKLNPIDEKTAKTLSVQGIKHPTWKGFEVVGASGEIYRRFIDTNSDRKIDHWCYFNNGIEVYRDIDTDGNNRVDEYRWLGTAGTRWGIDKNEDRRIDRWKVISPEEVTREVVNALATGDVGRFTAVVATPTQIKDLGLGQSKERTLETKSKRAIADFESLAKRQEVVTANTRWVQFAATQPGTVPAGTDGSTKDVVAYENVVAMIDRNTGDANSSGQVMVGTLVQTTGGWRVIDLPSVGTDSNAVALGTGNLFVPSVSLMEGGESGIDQETQELVSKLESLDEQLTKLTKSSKPDRNKLTQLHSDRADVIEGLIQAAETSDEREVWVRQLVDTVGVAVQTGEYQGGVSRMKKIANKFASNNDNLAAYADYAAIGSEYVVKQTPDADFPKVQKWYLDALDGFVVRYPKTEESAKAYLQLALARELDENGSDALSFYKRVVRLFPNSDESKKAEGAIRRLESTGKVIALDGRTVTGKAFRLSSLRGNPVIVHYWATWCEPCKQDMKLLRRLQAQYAKAGLTLVGVNVDNTREQATNFLTANRLPWVQLFEPGGLESSPLANQLGVQTLPTILLIDRTGKVVRHNIRSAELDDELAKIVR